jgi:hypothetical protein
MTVPKRMDERSREDDVADQAEADEQDSHWKGERRSPYGSIVASSISITGMSSLIG